MADNTIDRDAPITCPHCRRRQVVVALYQATYNTQDYDPESDEYGSNDWGDGDNVYGASCQRCGGDLTAYLIRRRGWQFDHDVTIPQAVEVPTRWITREGADGGPGRRVLNPDWHYVQGSDPALAETIADYKRRLGLMLDEQIRRERSRKRAEARRVQRGQ